jgi:hypothetical protein
LISLISMATVALCVCRARWPCRLSLSFSPSMHAVLSGSRIMYAQWHGEGAVPDRKSYSSPASQLALPLLLYLQCNVLVLFHGYYQGEGEQLVPCFHVMVVLMPPNGALNLMCYLPSILVRNATQLVTFTVRDTSRSAMHALELL